MQPQPQTQPESGEVVQRRTRPPIHSLPASRCAPATVPLPLREGLQGEEEEGVGEEEAWMRAAASTPWGRELLLRAGAGAGVGVLPREKRASLQLPGMRSMVYVPDIPLHEVESEESGGEEEQEQEEEQQQGEGSSGTVADPDVVVENRPSRGLSLLEGVEEMAKSVIPRTLHLGDSRDSLIMAGGSQSDVADADVPPLAASYPRRAVKVTVEQHAGMSQSAPSFDPTDMASLPMDDPRRQSWSARGPMLIHQAVSTSQHALGITRKDPNMRAKVSKEPFSGTYLTSPGSSNQPSRSASTSTSPLRGSCGESTSSQQSQEGTPHEQQQHHNHHHQEEVTGAEPSGRQEVEVGEGVAECPDESSLSKSGSSDSLVSAGTQDSSCHSVPSPPGPVPATNSHSSANGTPPPRPAQPPPRPPSTPPEDGSNSSEDEDADIVFSPMADMPGALPVSSSPHSTASSSKAAEDSEPKVSEEEKAVREAQQKETRRQYIYREFFSTEVSYTTSLRLILKHFLPFFQQLEREKVTYNGVPISSEVVRLIFGDIEVMLSYNMFMLEEWKNLDENTGLGLAKIMCKYIPFFRTYKSYCGQYDKSLDLLATLSSSPEFEARLQEVESDPILKGLNLSAFLIMPIQRIPRYKLLLTDLLKFTVDPTAKESIDEALKAVSQLANEVNASVRDLENLLAMGRLREKITGYPGKIVEPHRSFVCQSKMLRWQVVQSVSSTNSSSRALTETVKKPESCIAILFSDLLVVCSDKTLTGSYPYKTHLALKDACFGDLPEIPDDPVVRSSIQGKFPFCLRPLRGKQADILILASSTSDEETGQWRMNIERIMEQCLEDSAASSSVKAERRKTRVLGAGTPASSTLDLAVREAQLKGVDIEATIKEMFFGAELLKYPRSGSPALRYFFLNDKLDRLQWKSKRRGREKEEAYVLLSDSASLIPGQACFSRLKDPEIEKLCFTIKTNKRSVDIACTEIEQVESWKETLRQLILWNTDPAAHQEELTRMRAMIVELQREGQKVSAAQRNLKSLNYFAEMHDLYVWGEGHAGALGNGKQEDSLFPIVIKDFLFLDAMPSGVSCGHQIAGACTVSGDLFTWGAGVDFRLGNGVTEDQFRPMHVSKLAEWRIMQVEFGLEHTLARDFTGKVFAWGNNEKGACGVSLERMKAVAGEDEDSTGSSPASSPLGKSDSDFKGMYITTPTRVEFGDQGEGSEIIQIAAGDWHSAALTVDGRVFTWGHGLDGQLGYGEDVPMDHASFEPRVVPFLESKEIVITTIRCGTWHTVALSDTGDVYTWGGGSNGQLGHLPTHKVRLDSYCNPTPTRVEFNNIHIKMIDAGSLHTLCVSTNDCLYAFGSSVFGQIGAGSNKNAFLPVPVVLDTREQTTGKSWRRRGTSASSSASFCAGVMYDAEEVATGDEEVDMDEVRAKYVTYCSKYHQASSQAPRQNEDSPVWDHPCAGVVSIKDVACGANHSMALVIIRGEGKGNRMCVLSWGSGTYGRLGVGSETNSNVPIVVSFFSDKEEILRVSGGGALSVAVARHQWVPDRDKKSCMDCNMNFTMFRRRHHCRHCGGLFCGKCSSKKFKLLKFGFYNPVRVCDECFLILSKWSGEKSEDPRPPK